MEFTASPSDFINAANAARKIEANPVYLAGRLLGLSGTEMRAGLPVWAWTGLAFSFGVVVGVQYGGQVKKTIREVL